MWRGHTVAWVIAPLVSVYSDARSLEGKKQIARGKICSPTATPGTGLFYDRPCPTACGVRAVVGVAFVNSTTNAPAYTNESARISRVWGMRMLKGI